MKPLRDAVTAFLDFIDTRKVVRRIAFFWMLWLTTETAMWAIQFAATSPRPGVEVAAIIASVLGFITTLQGAIIGVYNYGRMNSGAAPHTASTGAQP